MKVYLVREIGSDHLRHWTYNITMFENRNDALNFLKEKFPTGNYYDGWDKNEDEVVVEEKFIPNKWGLPYRELAWCCYSFNLHE